MTTAVFSYDGKSLTFLEFIASPIESDYNTIINQIIYMTIDDNEDVKAMYLMRYQDKEFKIN